MATIARLKELIGETHKHGLALEAEIKHLTAVKPRGWVHNVAVKRALLAGLKALNAKRRVELAILEHKPVPKPPAPKPTPPKPTPKPPAPRFHMYDSTNVDNIPSDPTAVAAYNDGTFNDFDKAVVRFPHAKHLSITVFASADAGCLDIENGDATPGQAPAWVRKQHARGVARPVVYANSSTMEAVLAALNADFIKRGEYLVWTAHYTNVPHIEPGSDATQYEDHRELYDVSLCQPWFL